MAHFVTIAQKPVGRGYPAYIIAEAGSNHNGDLAQAKELIAAAAAAGADAIKFQAFRAREHYSKHTPGFRYLEINGNTQSTYDLIRSLEIDRDWHPLLIDHARSCGITFLSSPCDHHAVSQLGKLGMEAFKVASFDLPDIYLIREMATFQKPMLLSTGMATYEDIQTAIHTCTIEGNNQIVLLQCTSLYPAPPNLTNLAAIRTMQRAFPCPVGYSDHTTGDHIACAAVAAGACMIEKHFTLDRSLPGPDHNFAIEPVELAAMIRKIREIESAIGDGMKNGPRDEEQEMFEKGRRSIHTVQKVAAGQVISKENLCIKRPGYGISPRLLDTVAGMIAKKDIPEDHWITWEDFKL